MLQQHGGMQVTPHFTIDVGSPPTQPAKQRSVGWLQDYLGRIKAGYDAAKTTPENERWWAAADSRGPNVSASRSVRHKLAQRARYECQNNTYLHALVELTKLYVINTGPQLLLPTIDAKTANLIQHEFARWARAVRLAPKLRTMIGAKKIAGAGIAEKITNPRLNTPVKLDLRLLEIEQIQDPRGDDFIDPLRQDGISFDEYGNPVSYRRLKYHPNDAHWAGSVYDYDDLGAEQIIYWYREQRPGQLQGVCEIAGALPLAAEMRRYTLATIAHAETAASHAGVLRSQTTNINEEVTDIADNEFIRIELERRALMTLPKGWQMDQFQSSTHTANYKEFRTALLEEISRATLAPLNTLSGNSRDANFASAQMDGLVWNLVCEIEQQDCECVVLDNIFNAWLMEAVLIPDYLPPVPTTLGPRWRWPKVESANPLQQARTEALLWSLGLRTDEEYFDEHGIDRDEHYAALMRQTAARREIAPSFPQPNDELISQFMLEEGVSEDGSSDDSDSDETISPREPRPRRSRAQNAQRADNGR